MDKKQTALTNMHQLFLEALRHREQEIFRYLVILGPTIGGFMWLINNDAVNDAVNNKVFVVGTVGVLLLLLLGAVYAIALGYNYRYITLQLAKIETKFDIKDYMLGSWPRMPDEFVKRYRFLGCPCCTPPDIIKVFWLAFLAGIIGVTVSTYFVKPSVPLLVMVIHVGVACLVVGGLLAPWYYGQKLHELCNQEDIENWTPDRQDGNP